MTDLTTTFLGHELPQPFVPGASSLTDDLGRVRQLQDAGCGLLTLRSLLRAPLALHREQEQIDAHSAGRSGASVWAGLHEPPAFAVDPHQYCEYLRRVRETVGSSLPVVASLYARRPEDWSENAALLEQAGAAAVELNTYGIAVLAAREGADPEAETAAAVAAVHETVSVPIIVKLLPTGANLENFVQSLAACGAQAVVLFNGFAQSGMGVEPVPPDQLHLGSSPFDRIARYRALAQLSHGVSVELAFSGGARNGAHGGKAILCGASVVQVVSVLMHHGIAELRLLAGQLRAWLDRHGFSSLLAARGQLSRRSFASQEEFELEFRRQVLD